MALEYQDPDSVHALVADSRPGSAWHAVSPPLVEDAPDAETLAERLADRLRDMIVTEEFAVGTPLQGGSLPSGWVRRARPCAMP